MSTVLYLIVIEVVAVIEIIEFIDQDTDLNLLMQRLKQIHCLPRRHFGGCITSIHLTEVIATLKIKVRNRFRLPYDSFIELLTMMKHHPTFLRWNRHILDNGTRISLLLLGVLRYLGR